MHAYLRAKGGVLSLAQNGRWDLVAKVVVSSERLNINEIENGYTLLHHAAQQGKLDIIKYLIENKVAPPTLIVVNNPNPNNLRTHTAFDNFSFACRPT